MIIDCHGHYTTEPKDLHRFRKEQTAAANAKDKTAMPSRAALKMSDDEIRAKMTERARTVWSLGDFARAGAEQALAAELAGCLDRFNRATDGTLVAPAGYLQILATRAAGE